MAETGLPVLPAQHDGRPIAWGPWRPTQVNTIAACGHPRVTSTPCKECGATTVLHASGRCGREVRAYALHCTSCGRTQAAWRTDFVPGRWAGRLVPIEMDEGPK